MLLDSNWMEIPLDDSNKEGLWEILRLLIDWKEAALFLEPVDVVRLEIPDYLQIVKKPMCL